MKFFDTNILVYVADIRDPQKQRIAEDLVAAALGSDDVLISEQVLNEFSDDMRVICGELGGTFEVVPLSELLPHSFGPKDLGVEAQ